MNVIQITPLAKARISRGQVTPGGYFMASVRSRVDSESQGQLEASRVTLEALVPRGARAEYALLGFAFEKYSATTLEVEVQYSDGKGVPWPESLAKQIDDVRLGLPLEYADSILVAASSFVSHRFPPGRLSVVEAAHGLVGSSADMFRRVTLATLSLMHAPASTEEQVVGLLKGILVG